MNTSTTLSVTEVRNGMRCPRLFTLGRMHSSVAFPIGSSCMGSTFHRVIERFAKSADTAPPWLTLKTAKSSEMSVVRGALRRWVLDFLIEELDAKPLLTTMPSEVDDLAEACREFADHLVEKLQAWPKEGLQALPRLLHSGEKTLEAHFPEAGLNLRGSLDAIFGRPEGGLEVVEYKLTDEANQSLDEAQVALYRELFKRSQQKEAGALLLRFSPKLQKTQISPTKAEALLRSEILPLMGALAHYLENPNSAPGPQNPSLCAHCPMLHTCVQEYPQNLSCRNEPPANASRPRPDASGELQPSRAILQDVECDSDLAGEMEASEIREKILEELRKLGVSADAGDPVVGPTLYLIGVSRLRGSVQQMDRVAQDVCHRLASRDQLELSYERQGHLRLFIIPRSQPRPVRLNHLLALKKDYLAASAGRFVVGQEPDGRVLTGDLSDSATAHLLIGGQTGSGKSWVLKSILSSLVHFHDPADLQLTLLDPKRVTFNQSAFMSAIQAHCHGPVLYDLQDAMPCLEHFIEIMEARYEHFKRAQVQDLPQYNDTVGPFERLCRHVIVMDEFQDLTSDKKNSQAFSSAVERLGAKARAAGVHLILATQRPDKDSIPSRLKANLNGKIALKVATQINSRIILDQAGAEKLLGNGDLLADLGRGITRAQGPMLG